MTQTSASRYQFPSCQITSLMKIFKISNALIELDNSEYSECSAEIEICVCSFYTHNRGQVGKFKTNPVLLIAKIGYWGFSFPHSPAKYASA